MHVSCLPDRQGLTEEKEENPMHTALEPQPHHRMLHHKMKDSFTPSCLTVLSVIQGVAVADLASVVAAGYQQFTLVQWLQVVLTFAILIIMWDAYMQQSALWEWIPDIRDAAIPFTFGALELFLNHTISLSLSAWLFALALLSGISALANWHGVWRARKEGENAQMLSLMGRQTRWIVFFIGWSVVLLGLSVASRVGRLEASEGMQGVRGVLSLALVLLVVGGTAVVGLMSMRNWSKIVAYTRTGQMPPGWHAEDLVK
jgi:hypothetical protein